MTIDPFAHDLPRITVSGLGGVCRFTRASLAAVALAVTFIAAGPAAAEKISVLILDGQNNHNWRATTPVLEAALEESGRFAVTVSTSPDKKAPQAEWDQWRPAFAKYDVVLSNYNGQMWPDPVRESFVQYVRDGGGFVVIHAANNAFGNWDEYNRIIGLGGWGGRNEKSGPYIRFRNGRFVRVDDKGRGGSHGSQHPFVVEVHDHDHPITRGLPARWLHAKDELYDRLRGPAENMTVLATAYADPEKRGSGEHEPMIMTIEYGKGRVFHTPMGHADYSMKCQGFVTVLRRGTEWAATGKVTQPVPENFPTEKKAVEWQPGDS